MLEKPPFPNGEAEAMAASPATQIRLAFFPKHPKSEA
jgi:hypothetical protein